MAIYKKGDKVILGRHDLKSNGQPGNWDPTMEQYVGMEATIVKSYNVWDGPHVTYIVDVDKGRFYWREVNMTPIGVASTVSAPTKASGDRCICCRNFCEYAEPSLDFKCWGCSH